MFDNRYITVVEFGKLLRIGRNKAYEIIKKDCTIPIVKIDRRILIDKTKLDVWLENKARTSLNI